MTYIYSDVDVGIQGAYIAPRLFDGAIKDAKVVYTDDAKIAEAYTGIEVKPIGGVEDLIVDDELVPEPIDQPIDKVIDEVVLQPTKKGK